jgi:hypothetical protein
MKTEYADFIFTKKDDADGEPWIAFEPGSQALRGVKGSLGFKLKKDTTHQQADELIRLLWKHVEALSFTTK